MSPSSSCAQQSLKPISFGATVRNALWPVIAVLALFSGGLPASDHADPLDIKNSKPLEPGITDLFVFPVSDTDEVPHFHRRDDKICLHFDYDAQFLKPRPKLSDAEQKTFTHMVFILCVRRALADRKSLKLEPYTYKIRVDHNNVINYEDEKEPMPTEAKGKGYGSGYGKKGEYDGKDKKGAGYVGGDAKKNGAGGQGGEAPAGYAGGDSAKKGDKIDKTAMGKEERPISRQEARARYGGEVARPDGIEEQITFTINLAFDDEANDVKLKQLQAVGLKKLSTEWLVKDGKASDQVSVDKKDNGKISIYVGVRDDPFIFPAFFGTNVVAMVLRVPIEHLPAEKDWLIWATSADRDRQIDHVGRSLRTQNPRFEILNIVHPSRQVAALRRDSWDPNLLRDAGERLAFQGVASYRRWDFVPDVMIYKRDYRVGFPNGRVLFDDVAAALAQFGDTALLELSYQHPRGSWPRSTVNDRPFNGTTTEEPHLAKFPYLGEPHTEREQPSRAVHLTSKNQTKVAAAAFAAVVVIAVATLILRRLVSLWKNRRKYL